MMKKVLDHVEYLLALHSIHGLGPIRLKNLLDYFSDPEAAWETSIQEMIRVGIPQNVAVAVVETRKKLEPEKYAAEIKESGIKWLTIYDDEYPKLLKEIYDPPLVLYYLGEILPQDTKTIAIVGTRKMTGYGQLVTEKFATDLALAGLTVVSGLARGVDACAHRAVIEAGGRTIAVLGGGLNKIFPPENIALAHKITNGFGAVISEFAPAEPSYPGNFPARNRIISGLSLATLVTEAAEDSGSLITAKQALEQNREVFAVPGPITSDLSKGPSVLIKQGAKLVTDPREILDELGFDQVRSVKFKMQSDYDMTDLEKRIISSLENEDKHIDEICRQLKLSAAETSASLIKMEILGFVKNLGGGNYGKVC